jgi:uncharacterized protein (DUF58 family)
MIPEDLIKRIRQIQIYCSRAVNASFAGQYESVFKGRGMQFDEVREYTPGDDIRTIDWNVTARMGRPFIKRFVEERELTVLFAVDLSASGAFGTVNKVKNDLAAEFCSLVALAAVKNNDKVGLLIFTDCIESFMPPKKGSRYIHLLTDKLLDFKMPHRKTNIPLALDYIARVLRRRATVFVVSDFIETGFKKSLSLLNKRHDVVAVPVRDRVEIAMPSVGLIEVQDAETGEIMLVDTSSRRFRSQYDDSSSRRFEELKRTLRSSNVDFIPIATDKPYINDLIQFFHMRHRRR